MRRGLASMERRGRLASVLVLLWLQGCAGQGFYQAPVGVGARVEILRELAVPAGLARVYLQGGRALSQRSAVDQYTPFCYLRMRAPAHGVRRIAPGSYRIERVELREQEVRHLLPLRLAGLALAGLDGPMVIAWESHFWLQGDAPDGPHKLVCSGSFAPPAEAAPIRLSGLRRALGGLVRVTPAPGSPSGR